MTDPQLPPSGAVPPVPPAPTGEPQPAPEFGAAPPASPAVAPGYPPASPAAPPLPGYPAYPVQAQPAYPAPQPGYPAAPPPPAPGYPAPTAQPAPPGAYQVPVGGYAAPAGAYSAPAASAKQSGLLGILALIFALVAAVVTPIVAGISGFEIGVRLPGGLEMTDPSDPDFLALLSPARDQVLWAEIAFWAGTLLGIAAIVVGIIAIRKRQRRGLGITALVLAVLGPIIFWVVLVVALGAGTAAGFTP